MRLHRFYINKKIENKKIDIDDKELIHQWKKVFRYNVGSSVIVFDGSGFEYICFIESLRAIDATLGILEKREILKPKNSLTMVCSIIKKDNFELLVEKLTEIGVNTIIPLISERTEKKKLNTERLLKIIKEASEQCGRGDLTILKETETLESLFQKGYLAQEKIFFDMDRPPIENYFKSFGNQKSFAIFIGPEGGWSNKDKEIFSKYNINGYSMGFNTLRAETAGIVASGLFLV